MNTESDSFNNL